MSYIGGPLPGQEIEEQEDDNLLEMWKEKRIGTETIDNLVDISKQLIQKIPEKRREQIQETASNVGSFVGEKYQDARTLEGSEWLSPGDVATAGTVRALEGVGWASDKLIQGGSWVGHNVFGLDKRLADAVAISAEMTLGGGVVTKGSKILKSAKQIRKLNKAGATLEALDAVNLSKGKVRAFASGTEDVLKTQAKATDALFLNEKSRQALNRFSKELDAIKSPYDNPNWTTSRISTSDFDKLDVNFKETVVDRNIRIGKYEAKVQDFNKRLLNLETDNWIKDPYYMRTSGSKAGIPRTKEGIKKMIIGKRKEQFRSIQDMKSRDLLEKYDTMFSKKNPTYFSGAERHHLAGLSWAEPFFDGLNATDAQALRTFAAKHNIYFGNDLRNRIDIHKRIHQGSGRNLAGHPIDIHTWLNDVGYNHKNLEFLKGASIEVRQAAMSKMIDQINRQKFKLVELQLMDVKDLRKSLTPEQFKKYQSAQKVIKKKGGKAEDMLTINLAKSDMQSDLRKKLKIK